MLPGLHKSVLVLKAGIDAGVTGASYLHYLMSFCFSSQLTQVLWAVVSPSLQALHGRSFMASLVPLKLLAARMGTRQMLPPG